MTWNSNRYKNNWSELEDFYLSGNSKNKMTKFAFLSSPRFWQLFIAGVAVGIQVYQSTGDILSAVSAALGSWFAGSVVVGTVDKMGDKKIIAEGVASGKVDVDSVVHIPPQE